MIPDEATPLALSKLSRTEIEDLRRVVTWLSRQPPLPQLPRPQLIHNGSKPK